MKKLMAYLRAAWDFLSAPDIDLNTDFCPEFPSISRNFRAVVFHEGMLVFEAQISNCMLCQQEIELLFIEAGYPASWIDVVEV